MKLKLTLPLLLAVLGGIPLGLGAYTFLYARGYSYLSNNPAACINCHVMNEHFDGWVKSSHRSVATCNDCHTPHNFVGKYAIKAANGFAHSWAFTTGRFPDVIQIKGYNRRVTEQTCRDCHQEIVTSIIGAHSQEGMSCVRCHGSVGHSASSFVVSAPATPSGNSKIEEGMHAGSLP